MKRLIALAAMMMLAAPAVAQWLKYPTPGIPRTVDGRPDLGARPPRAPDGRPDLSGVWQFNLGVAYSTNLVADLRADEIAPWADALFRKRMANLGADDSSLVGCLPRGPRFILGSGPVPQFVKIVQNPGVTMILSEELAFRQVFTDGRALPRDPNPTFMGYSVGHWDGEVFIVESNGFNDRTWLDFGGHPHTEALHIMERFRRTSVGQMELQVTLSDTAYARPWTVPVAVTLAPDTEILEYVCNENETRRTSIGLTAAERSVAVSPAVLTDYVGMYDITIGGRGGSGIKTLTIRNSGTGLVLDVDGKGNLPLVPLSQTTFSTRILDLEFVRDGTGVVTRVINVRSGQRFDKRR